MQTAGPRGHLLGRRRRARARAARRDAAAVHADDGRRRLPDPDRVDPRRGNAAAGAALATTAVAASAASGSCRASRGSRAGPLGAARPLDHGAARRLPRRPGPRPSIAAAVPGVLPAAHAGLDVRHPAHAAVDARLRRARRGGRAGRGRAGAGARADASRLGASAPACRRRSAGSSPRCAGTPRSRRSTRHAAAATSIRRGRTSR